MVEKDAPVPVGLAERPGGILSEAYDANIARQCSGGKVVRCTGRSAEHSPVSRGYGGSPSPETALFSCTAGVHVLFSAGRKENVGLELWVLEITTLWLAEANTKPAAWYFPPRHSLISTTSSVTALPCHLPLKGKAWLTLPYSARNFSIS